MRKRFFIITIICILLILAFQISSLAVIDQAKLFIAQEWTSSSSAVSATSYAVRTFQTLGYDIQGGLPVLKYTITNNRNDILNWLSGDGNNYAFYVFAHGADGRFNMSRDGANAPQRIYASDITGYWHFVFLNCCSSMETDSLARAFKTTGYSNRASLGWYTTVTDAGSAEWWGYFKNVAGTTNLRSACLAAADNCSYSTPIRIYGDKTWNGYAWDK